MDFSNSLSRLVFPVWLVALSATLGVAADGLNVYGPIEGIAPSSRFSARVSVGKAWEPLFTMETVGPAKESKGVYATGIYDKVTGHSASWCTFESDVPVTVEITKLGEGEINQCVIRPLSLGLKPTISADKRSVTFSIKPRFVDGRQVPVNVAVELNGNTEEMMTVFASPHLEGKPVPDGQGVLAVRPGERPPAKGDWKTLYFLPGVHDLGLEPLALESGKTYYIPGDTWVDGSIGDSKKRVHDTRVFGLGVLSGRKLGWREVKFLNKGARTLQLFGENNVFEGITIIDSPFHTILAGSRNPARPTLVRNVKMHNWRINTDGIHFFGSGTAEDCFIHSQDDSHYTASAADVVRFHRMVYWRDDTFGVDIILSAGGGQKTFNESITEDCDSIYNQSTWGGVHFENRSLGEGETIDGVVIKDFRIENPGKNKPLVRLTLDKGPCTFRNVHFKNITALTDNGHAFELFGGGPEALIEDVTFEDFKVGDRYIEDFSHRNFNMAFVKNIRLVRDGKVVATYSSDIEAEAKALNPDPQNLLKNPDFEIGAYLWTGGVPVGVETVSPKNGDTSLKMVPEMGFPKNIRQDIASQINTLNGLPCDEIGGEPAKLKAVQNLPKGFQPRHTTYRLTAWMKIDGGRGTGTVGLAGSLARLSNNNHKKVVRVTTPEVPLVPGEWVEVSGVVTIPWDYQEYDWLRLCHFVPSAKGNFKNLYFDACSVTPIEPQAELAQRDEASKPALERLGGE